MTGEGPISPFTAHKRNICSMNSHSETRVMVTKYSCVWSFEGNDNGTHEPQHEISNNVVGAPSKGSDRPVHMRILIRSFAGRLNIL